MYSNPCNTKPVRQSAGLRDYFKTFQLRQVLPSPTHMAEIGDLRDTLLSALKILSWREREIIKLRYGLNDGRAMSRKDIAVAFKVTPERVRNIESKSLMKLRLPSVCRAMEVFIVPQ